MPLIGKERGGHRAITTAPSLYRLWGKLRRGYSQQWEADHDRPYFAAGKGRSAHDVVWRQMVAAEAGAGDGQESAAVMWDLASFFDTLNRVRLWRLVRKHGYPLPIARLAFAMYDAPRTLALEGRLSCPAFARNGVPAGCPFAMALTRVYCLDSFDKVAEELAAAHGETASFDAYVDDLTLAVTGPEGTVVHVLVDAARSLEEEIHDVMGCEVEADKAAVVASTQRLRGRWPRGWASLEAAGGATSPR
jgi:hypothetical protein